MKSLRNGFLALALVAGLTGAFASNVHAAAKTSAAVFNWQQTNHEGNLIIGGQFDEEVTNAQAEVDFGCNNTASTYCARTVDQQDGTITADGAIMESR